MSAAASAVVPGEPAERVPVRLRERVAAPVAVVADVGDGGDAAEQVAHAGRHHAAVDDVGDGRLRAVGVGVGVERLLEQRRQVGEVRPLAEVLLRDLQLQHRLRARHRAEQRVERLARLEVDRPVLHLQLHVRPERSVERHQLGVRLLGAILGDVGLVDERAPDDDALVRRERVRQHVGAVGVRAAVVLRAGLALGVRLDQEAAEVGDQRVDLVDLRAPPGGDGRVPRIGGGDAAELDRRAPARGEKNADPPRAKHVGQRRHLAQVGRRQDLRAGVDVVQRDRVDADRRVGARVVAHARRHGVGQLVPAPQRPARVAALDAAVQVVPVVEHAQADARAAGGVDRVERPAGLQMTQEMEHAVQHAGVGEAGDRERAPRAHRHAVDDEGVGRHPEQPKEGRLVLDVLVAQPQRAERRSDDQRRLGDGLREEGGAQQSRQPARQLVARGRQRRRRRGHVHRRAQRARLGESGGVGDRLVPEPEPVAVVGGHWTALVL